MIPKTITKKNIINAIEEIKIHGVPVNREPTKFYLVFEGRLYPPKYVLSKAARYATGTELPASKFSGGDESNEFLQSLGFEIKHKANDWSWKECYFAVWGYDQLDQDREQIKTALYHEIASLIGRSAGAVEWKICNVSAYDPRPKGEKPIAEAPNTQALLGEVFNWYWADRLKARRYYPQYREEFVFSLANTTLTIAPTSNRSFIVEEGAQTQSTSTRRKRSQKLLDAGRQHFRRLDKEGKLRCQACQFTAPAGVDSEIIHLHHTQPIYEADETGRSLALEEALKLLIPLCPTCHALAHSSKPPLSVEGVRWLRAEIN
jgi:hypothetical protein